MKTETKRTFIIEKDEDISSALSSLITSGAADTMDEIRVCGSTWRILEKKDDTLRLWLCRGNAESRQFNASGSNIYKGSDIQKYLHSDEFRATVPAGFLELVQGDFDLLSVDEIEKYMPEEIQRIFCDENGETWWYWTRSANRANSSYVWRVYASGHVNITDAVGASRCAPSVYIKAI